MKQNKTFFLFEGALGLKFRIRRLCLLVDLKHTQNNNKKTQNKQPTHVLFVDLGHTHKNAETQLKKTQKQKRCEVPYSSFSYAACVSS